MRAQSVLAVPELLEFMGRDPMRPAQPMKPETEPVDPHDGTATAEMLVADRLKQLRREKGLTLSQLASAVGLSTGYLSRIENHKMSIPIASLEKLARVMNVSISVFFEEQSDRPLLALCRNGEGRAAQFRPPRGYRYQILAPTMKGKFMEPLIVDVTPQKVPPRPQPHAGEEFNYILEGECEMIFGKQKIRLRQGDSVYYDASVPHCTYSLPGSPECRLLSVIGSRDYLFHGDLSRLLNEVEEAPQKARRRAR